jgi:hypothetical protein
MGKAKFCGTGTLAGVDSGDPATFVFFVVKAFGVIFLAKS